MEKRKSSASGGGEKKMKGGSNTQAPSTSKMDIPTCGETEHQVTTSQDTSVTPRKQEDYVEHFEFVLEQCRRFLQDKLILRQDILLDHLVERGVITQNEKDFIETVNKHNRTHCKDETNRIQVDELVSTLKTKDTEMFCKFCQILQEMGKNNLFQYLRETISRSVTRIQQLLSDYFVKYYSQVQLTSFHDEDYHVKLEEIYVPLKTASYTNMASGQKITKDLTDYTDLFSKLTLSSSTVILIRGKPMAGKTTFLKKIAHDWSCSLSSDEFIKLRQFSLVIPIILQCIRDKCTLLESVFFQLPFLKKEEQAINWILKNKSQNVLFILDGLDEFNTDMCPEIVDCLRGVLYKKCVCVITSRNEGVQKLTKLQVIVDIQADLIGFGDKEVKKFILLALGKNNLSYELIQKIFATTTWWSNDKAHKYLHTMATNPGELDLLCLVWKQNQNLANHPETLLSEIVRLLLKLSYKRRSVQIPVGDLLKVCSDVLIRFGKLAMLRRESIMTSVFRWQEVISTIGNNAMDYSFLYKSHPVDRYYDSEYSFLHKSLQEWFAAYYITEQNAWGELSYDTIEEISLDTNLHKFIQDLNPSSMDNIARVALKRICRVAASNEQLRSLLLWFINTRISIDLLDLLEGSEFVKSPNLYLKDQPELHDSLYILGCLLRILPQCNELDLQQCDLNGGDLQQLTQGLRDPHEKIAKLVLNTNPQMHGSLKDLGGLIRLLPNCKQLSIMGCSLTGGDLQQLKSGLAESPTEIEVIWLHKNRGLKACEPEVVGLLDMMSPGVTCWIGQTGLNTEKLKELRPNVKFKMWM